jgi:hypothetical protein
MQSYVLNQKQKTIFSLYFNLKNVWKN